MKTIKYMLLRLINPILFLTVGGLFNIEILIGMGLGYFFCWAFSWNLIKGDAVGRK